MAGDGTSRGVDSLRSPRSPHECWLPAPANRPHHPLGVDAAIVPAFEATFEGAAGNETESDRAL